MLTEAASVPCIGRAPSHAFLVCMLSAHGNISAYFHCTDISNKQSQLAKDFVLPWLTGWFPERLALPTVTAERLLHQIAPTTYENLCRNDLSHLSRWIPFIELELRRMAIGLLGVPKNRPEVATYAAEYLSLRTNVSSYDFTEVSGAVFELPVSTQVSPLFAKEVGGLDDAIIHFRCGDLVVIGHPAYHFLKYEFYARHISPDARSIGIVTQPFDESSGQSRKNDIVLLSGDRCRSIVNGLVDYLHARFPRIRRISIHNGPQETVALSMGRMIMAKQTIASVSTFSAMPGVASFGIVYIPESKVGHMGWILEEPRVRDDKIVFVDSEHKLNSLDLVAIWIQPGGSERIMEWFRNDTDSIED